MEIHDVTFRGSMAKAAQAPPEWLPHVAVAGRSNVGKSSLLNWLLGRSVARVAKAPGKTRALNFFLVNRTFYLVDLPGYGYAKVSRELRDEWGRELGRYLAEERRLAGVLALVDCRHEPTALDDQLQQLLLAGERERVVVLTKADKLGRGRRAAARHAVQRRYALATPPLAVSVRTGEGRHELLREINLLNERWRRRESGESDGT